MTASYMTCSAQHQICAVSCSPSSVRHFCFAAQGYELAGYLLGTRFFLDQPPSKPVDFKVLASWIHFSLNVSLARASVKVAALKPPPVWIA